MTILTTSGNKWRKNVKNPPKIEMRDSTKRKRPVLFVTHQTTQYHIMVVQTVSQDHWHRAEETHTVHATLVFRRG
jgi:hypothetical protein